MQQLAADLEKPSQTRIVSVMFRSLVGLMGGPFAIKCME
jgi:hypothetical protein